jgi:hypothetical protein
MPPTTLLNPRRSAHATIRGYLYQACLGVLRWLDLQPNEILLCEGDEDLDRFLLGGESISEQVKAYTGSLSLSDRAVLESLGNFLRSYVTLRQRGESRKFVFTTTAAEKRPGGKGLDFDLLEAWKSGKRTKKVLNGARSLLKPKKKEDKNWQETTDAIAWLDAQPDGWKDFLDAVEWSFDAPDLDAIRGKIKSHIALLEDTQLLPADTLLERLISHVFRVSSQPDPQNRTLSPESLSDLLDAARADLGNWVKTPAAERLRTVFDELKQVHRLLHDNTAKLPKNAAPGKLLTAAYEVIPFDQQGRREELDFLASWCDGDDRKSVLLLTGEGGSGKTRLMIEWCRHLRHQGWHAGFLGRDRKVEELDPLLEGLAPRLIVIDYAETRLEVVEPLLLKMGLSKEVEPKLRLVLLARRKADWWNGLLQKGREVEDLLLGSPDKAMTPLVPRNVQERKQAFQSAVEGFALQMARKPPQDLFVPDLTREHFDRALYLHMAALAALQGERIESAEGALRETLKHERLFWDQQVSDLRLDGTWEPLVRKGLETLVAAITLVGGAQSREHAQSILDRTIGNSPLQGQHADALLRLLRDLYVSAEDTGRLCDPLQPDLLGEELVAENLNSEFLGQLLEESTLEEGYSTLTVLTRLAQRRPSLSSWIGVALGSNLEMLAQAAIDVAVETGDPVGTQLALALEQSDSIEVLLQIRQRCDEDKYQLSVPLREVAHVATEKWLTLLRARQADLSEEEQSENARLASNLGVRLSGLGRREDALNATNEAVQIHRLLAQQRPDAFNPDLAMSLDNLGNRLSELGRREDALNATYEAVQIQRLLAQQRPDAFNPNLALSLNNLGIRLSDLGRREDALNATNEAVQIRRLLAQQRPDAFNPDLASSLNNLGNRLSELGRREDALNATNEAVQIHRLLAQQRPDAFNPDLASSLNNLGSRLSDLGRREDALNATNEAVQIRRLLAQQRPDAFNPDLASSLNNLGNRLSDLGRREDALNATNEAVQIYRLLAKHRPDAFNPVLASSLNNLGIGLSELGRREDALNATNEAVQIRRLLAQQRPDVFNPDLASSLNNLGIELSELGWREDALNAINEAVQIYRLLAKHRPDVFNPVLASSLNNLGNRLSDLGRQEEAVQASEEAVRTFSPFFLRFPQAFGSRMTTMVSNYLKHAEMASREPDEELLAPIRRTTTSGVSSSGG